jgi:hypothetical protein
MNHHHHHPHTKIFSINLAGKIMRHIRVPHIQDLPRHRQSLEVKFIRSLCGRYATTMRREQRSWNFVAHRTAVGIAKSDNPATARKPQLDIIEVSKTIIHQFR